MTRAGTEVLVGSVMQKLAHDLRATLIPVYGDLLNRLTNLLPRKISPEALLALIGTLSDLFKYLLVPTSELKLLEDTWTCLRATLSKCIPEVQRAAAEAWGLALRRMRLPVREKSVVMIAQNLEGIEDACAWIFVFACKV